MKRDPKAIVREYFDRLFNKKDLSVCDALLAPNYIDHDAGIPSDLHFHLKASIPPSVVWAVAWLVRW